MRRPNYEQDDATFGADAYKVSGYQGIAWHVLGWETEPDKDTEWSGYENRTGKIVAVMVGDDRKFVFDQGDITPLESGQYCPSCGQTGCRAGCV
jgi:hypothetical protein